MTEFKLDLSDLSDAQIARKCEGAKPVVDLDGNGIGMATTLVGAARITLQMAHGTWTQEEVDELVPAIVERDCYYVVGGERAE